VCRADPRVVVALRRPFAPLDTLGGADGGGGLEPAGRVVPADVVANGDASFDARGPLRADWRAGDSAWSLVDGDALGRALGQVRSLDGHGELERFMTAHDAPARIGQVTVVAARSMS
jgi:hypothetical protein